MALPSTILRFTLDLSDIDRGIYKALEFRVARHPSESAPFLLTRVIAYVLNLQEGIEFTGGISTPDDPAIWVKDLTGVLQTWIDVGSPSAKRLHKACKAAKTVCVYTYRDPKPLLEEIISEKVYGADAIEIFSLAPKFLSQLESTLQRDNAWQLLRDEGELSVTANGVTVQGILSSHSVKSE